MSSIAEPIRIVDYDPEWPATFERLRARIARALDDCACRIEHVGSTAVPGLAAKPIIDIDVIVPATMPPSGAIARLQASGYRHEGDLGITGREALLAPAGLPAHHLYVCAEGSPALWNHLTVRDALRADPALACEYARLKRRLAGECGGDRAAYVDGKAAFLGTLLAS